MKPLLEIEKLRAGYGAINVLWDVDVSADAGNTTVIVGPNGAGKTTLLRAVMGLIPTASGDIRYDGTSVSGSPTWNSVANGLVMVPEGRMVFADMSVQDNLMMGAFPGPCRKNWRSNLDMVFEMFPRLAERRSQNAGSLSGGEAQMLAIGRGLMEQPRICILDEPSLGLAPVIVDEIFNTVKKLKAENMTIILVEQNTARALEVADHVYLMQSGKVVLNEEAKNVNMDKLHDLYFARGEA